MGLSLRDFKKGLDKQRKEQQVLDQLKSQLRVLEERRDQYAEEAKKELKKGNKAQYSAMVALMKYTMYNISMLESMVANYTIAKEMADIQSISKSFNKSLKAVLKDVVKSAESINASKTQKLFDKALQKSNETSIKLKECLKNNNCSFVDSINDMSEVSDEDVSMILGIEVESEKKEQDDLLDSMLEELVPEEKQKIAIGGDDVPQPEKNEKKNEEPKPEEPIGPSSIDFDYHGPSYIFPSISLLEDQKDQNDIRISNEEDMKSISDKIIEKLLSFGVRVELSGIVVGASYSRLEYQLRSNTQLSQIGKLSPDVMMAIGRRTRFLLPIPGKNLIGIEVENKKREILNLKSVLMSSSCKNDTFNIPIGFDIERNPVFCDIPSMPHLLIGGSTGSGKSVFLSSLITSILYRYDPKDVRLVLIDFKRVEMNIYNFIPHLVTGKSIDEFKDAFEMLENLCEEMERRYSILTVNKCRNIEEYNRKSDKKISRIVTIIDEYADMVANPGYKEAQVLIQKLVQKARAAGIHIVIATQRPSVKVIDGVIKANLPTRLSFMVSSHIDSMTILDESGAEELIGKGDLLFQFQSETIRLQAPYVSTDEIMKVVESISE